MNTNIWFVSDTHFNHNNILKFLDKDGKNVRNFESVEHMNETMIENWNEYISPNDKVYHLGDVYMGPKQEADEILSRLNGSKRLILGNHDNYKCPILNKHFKKIIVSRRIENIYFTHYPLHVDVLEEKFSNSPRFNVHGHIHEKTFGDDRYMNISVEKTNYKPIHFDEIYKNFSTKIEKV